MRFAIVLALIVTCLAGCRSEDAAATAKFDASLRQKAEQLADSKQVEVIPLFGKCSSGIDEAMKEQLAKTGLEVQTVTGDIFAGRISSNHLMKLAQLPFVTQLSLSQISKPLAP